MNKIGKNFDTGGFKVLTSEDKNRVSGPVFVVSEWLPKEGCEQQLWIEFKQLMQAVKEEEEGCLSARVTKQIQHPGSPGKSKYKIILLQEYIDIQAFDDHCASELIKNSFKRLIEDEKTALIDEWTCRLLSELE